MRKTLFLFLFLFVAGCGQKTELTEYGTPPKLIELSENIYLSIDGGGMLGMIPLIILEDIEKQTGKPIHKLVKGIVGTSTGAIVAGLMSLPSFGGKFVTTPQGKKLYLGGKPATAAQGLQFYKDAKGHAFSDEKVTAPTRNTSDITSSMEKELENTFKNLPLSWALTPLLIPTYQKSPEQGLFVFDSIKSLKDKSQFAGILAIRASISLISLFTPAEFEFDNQQRVFVDLDDTNVPEKDRMTDPTYLLYNELKKTLPAHEKATIYSLGTGFKAGPSQATINAMAETNSNIKIVRIDPDLSDLIKKIQTMLNGTKDIQARIIMSVGVNNGGAPELQINSVQAIEDAGRKLVKDSPEYQAMLTHMKKQTEKKAAE